MSIWEETGFHCMTPTKYHNALTAKGNWYCSRSLQLQLYLHSTWKQIIILSLSLSMQTGQMVAWTFYEVPEEAIMNNQQYTS